MRFGLLCQDKFINRGLHLYTIPVDIMNLIPTPNLCPHEKNFHDPCSNRDKQGKCTNHE